MLWFLAALQVKHFVADFLYQPPYQWKNKGTYGHLGGLVHSGQHVLLTGIIMALFGFAVLPIALVMIGEFLLHYHIDWAKMNINAHYGWGATTHNEFWQLTGLDQLLHSLTYVGIAACLY